MIEAFCERALADLAKHKNNDKEDLMLQFINERLDKSFNSYQEELQQGLDYLKRRNELNVLRRMNKLL